MPKNLVIVESPAKAKTIAKFLGNDFEVKSSFGHIRDLPKKDIGVEIDKGFKPTYQISADKKKVVSELKSAAKNSVVWLASDEDREGEAIAWHVSIALGLDPEKTKRIVFHEITKTAIDAAVANPRTIDMKLVDAQQARRILDRLVGYELSPVLWRKIRAGLSAGRVQSVAVRLIVEREREIKAHKPEINYKVGANFNAGTADLQAELNQRLDDNVTSKKFLNDLLDAKFTLETVDQKPGFRSPSAPFTTSTLQQEAARRLGYSVRQTMTLAQRLYENGHITYMRTDSLTLSALAISSAKDYITKEYGAKYLNVKQFKTKDSSAQEAHEAIRPTNFNRLSVGDDSSQKKLYDLIWRRTLASQMANAQIEKTEAVIKISTRSEKFTASGEVLTFDGYLSVYGGGKDDKILPPLSVGQSLDLIDALATESYSRPPVRYSEASLVRRLEQLGIGRPSTYAPTISTIQDREYVEKTDIEGVARQIKEFRLSGNKVSERTLDAEVGADRNKLFPTPLAEIVTDFLIKYVTDIVDYDFTARAEAQFDEVAEGKLTWQQMLDSFYKKFHPLVEASANAERSDASQARTLGKDPKSGKPVIARFGRYGPMLQLGEAGDVKDKNTPKPKFAPLPADTNLESVTLAQALPMFNLPREVGKTPEGQLITADIGRFGPYIKVDGKFISIKGQDALMITETEANQAIADQAETARKKVIADFGKLKILRGPYGPYITDGSKNARIPKGQDPEALKETEAQELLNKSPDTKRKFKPKKKR